MKWTPEWIAAAKADIAAGFAGITQIKAGADEPWDDARIERAERLYTLARIGLRIGLRVVEASPETVERVARAIAAIHTPEYSRDEIWAEDVEMLRRQALRTGQGPFPTADAALRAIADMEGG